MYDVDTILGRLKLSQQLVDKIKKEARQEFPHDEMMFELHVLRTANAIKHGLLTPNKSGNALQDNPLPSEGACQST
ncbi:MAG: hypothetical protein ACD_62C00326G0003 [uncultured bacterium]|nr:MAG: hypothetical protein ACD_62C00326G0003 [uncultured bacterium]HLD45542.1 hypothetical protein [bacterium]